MIFNEMNNTAVSHEAVQESPYELGIGGALMHVYENECNYNAIMKAAALSEMKYYKETGGDLFVQEASAFRGFIEKIKAFFKKVIEKIKSIAKKFIAMINQHTMKDKDFVKKYSSDLMRRNLKDFEYDGYEFPLKKAVGTAYGTALVKKVSGDGSDDQDTINDIIEENRGKIIGKGSLTESEFRDELHEMLYGDKGEHSINISNQLSFISNTAKDIKEVQSEEKIIIKNIENIIKDLEKDERDLNKEIPSLAKDQKADETKLNSELISGISKQVQVYKAFSSDVTTYFGALSKAYTDRNKQARAICVKALSYKHEAATFAESGYSNDIFAGVEIV